MANAAITARKGAAKHGKPSVKAARKYGGKTKDRLTVEQRRRVMEYAKSLKAAPSFHCKSSSEIEVRSYLRPVKGKSREDPTPLASTDVFPATGRTPRKAETDMIGNKTPRDPPSFLNANEEDIGFGDDKKLRKKDPPSSKGEVREEDVHKTDKMEEGTHTCFTEEVRSRWDFFRRGMKALGIRGSQTNVLSIETVSDAVIDDDGPFYDAVEEYIEEHNSNEYDQKRESRSVFRGPSCVGPMENKRFSKPDP